MSTVQSILSAVKVKEFNNITPDEDSDRSLHSHDTVCTECFDEVVVADSCCCLASNGSDLLHSSQLSRLESCTVEAVNVFSCNLILGILIHFLFLMKTYLHM
jgi:hypothetical protein